MNLKEKLTNNKLTIGSWITIGHHSIVEIMASAGFEYAITEKLSFGLSHSSYDFFEEIMTSPSQQTDPSEDPFDFLDTNNDLDYNKIGFSIIYGFNASKKKEKS